MGKPLDGSDPAPSADSASRLVPRTQLQLSLRTSPSLSRQPPGRAKEDAVAAAVSGLSAVPSPGKCPGAQVNESPWPPSLSPAQAVPFRLMSRPQIMQVTSQPSFLGGPAAPNPREHVRSVAERVNSFSSSEVSGLGAPAPSSCPREAPYMGPTGSPRVFSMSEEMHSREKTKEGRTFLFLISLLYSAQRCLRSMRAEHEHPGHSIVLCVQGCPVRCLFS